MTSRATTATAATAGLGALAAAFAADLALAPDATAAFLYGAAPLFGLLAADRRIAVVLAAAATLAAVAAGAATLPGGVPDGRTMAVRGLAVLVLWTIALLVHRLHAAASAAAMAPAGAGDRGDVIGAGLRPPTGRTAAAVPAREPVDRDAEITRDLRDKESLYGALFNQTFQFVAALDTDGTIIEANDTLKDFAGLTDDEIRRVPLWLLPIFRADESIRQSLRESVESAARGDFSRTELEITGIAEPDIVIDFSLKPIHGVDGSVDRLIMEARDITESRMQQEMLLRAQRMEALGALTAGVAHDFNNLLMVVAGNLELLEKRLGAADERVTDRLRRAIDGVFRGQALTHQLLAFSRRQKLNPGVVDVSGLIESMSEMLQALSETVALELDLDPDLPPCEVDPVVLETAILNIAINARDAMPDGGTLRIATARIDLDAQYAGDVADVPPGAYVCLSISDTGTGMAPETVEQAFDPFFTTKPPDKGTGLGLSMAFGFARQSGGDIRIHSEPGRGTTVRFYLPVTNKPLSRPAGPGGVPGAGRFEGERVLLVEDDEAVRELAIESLLEMGFDVEAAESSDAAIEMIESGRRFDVLFTDLVMPGRTRGLDLVTAARAVMPGLRVIVCSGFPERSHDDAVFLAKPYRQEDLRAAIEGACGPS